MVGPDFIISVPTIVKAVVPMPRDNVLSAGKNSCTIPPIIPVGETTRPLRLLEPMMISAPESHLWAGLHLHHKLQHRLQAMHSSITSAVPVAAVVEAHRVPVRIVENHLRT